jgi:hypothetical protein
MEAIPTTFHGIRFRSRLEARFAEWLEDQGVKYVYNPDDFSHPQGYRPDFYLPWSDVYVEVKPEALRDELLMFQSQIESARQKWIRVDSLERGFWHITDYNRAFCGPIRFPLRVRFSFYNPWRSGLMSGDYYEERPQAFEIATFGITFFTSEVKE